jgi:acetate kinase
MRLLEIEFEEKRNAANEGMTSTGTSGIPVRVIPRDEERMIAKMACHVFGLD